MQKPVPSFPAVGKTSEVFEGIKPVIIVFTSNLVFKARGPPERSRDSDVVDEKTFLVLVTFLASLQTQYFIPPSGWEL